MTDNEIVKAKEHFKYGINCDIFQEPVLSYAKTVLWAFEEIYRQKAELERKDIEIDNLIKKKDAAYDEVAELKAAVERLQDRNNKCIYLSDNETTEFCVDSICPEFKTEKMIKDEAIKGFAEKLKEYFPSIAKAIDHTANELRGD